MQLTADLTSNRHAEEMVPTDDEKVFLDKHE